MARYTSPTVDKSAFEIEDKDKLDAQGAALTDETNAIEYDWTGVDSALTKLGLSQEHFEARAKGENLSSKTDAKLAQNTVGEGYSSLDGATATRAQKATGQQGLDVAAQTARNVAAEQLQNAQTASQLRRVQIDAAMAKQAQEMALEQSKFGITQNIAQAVAGLKNAQAAFTNQYNNLVATAKNGTEQLSINARSFNINNAFSYVGSALSAASEATAAMAGAAANSTGSVGGAATLTANGTPTRGLTAADAQYAQQISAQGYVSGATPGAATTAPTNTFSTFMSYIK